MRSRSTSLFLAVLMVQPLALYSIAYLFLLHLSKFARGKISIARRDFTLITICFFGAIFSFLNLQTMISISGYASTINYALFYFIIIFTLLSRNFKLLDPEAFVPLVTWIFFLVYVGSLIVLGDVGSHSSGNSVFAKVILNLDIPRTHIFLSGGVNHFGVTLGLILAISIPFLRIRGIIFKLIFFTLLGVLLVFTDSRGAMFGLFLVALLGLLKTKFPINFHMILLIPIILPVLALMIYSSGSNLGLERTNATLFSHRELIWIMGIGGFSEFTFLSLLFGYGDNGFLYNSIAAETVNLFEYRGSIGSLHNGYLGLLYDRGLIGILVIYLIFRRIWFFAMHNSSVVGNIYFNFIIYTFALAVSETVFSQNYVLFSVVMLLLLASKSDPKKRKVS